MQFSLVTLIISAFAIASVAGAWQVNFYEDDKLNWRNGYWSDKGEAGTKCTNIPPESRKIGSLRWLPPDPMKYRIKGWIIVCSLQIWRGSDCLGKDYYYVYNKT
jgi:hypothetical protein